MCFVKTYLLLNGNAQVDSECLAIAQVTSPRMWNDDSAEEKLGRFSAGSFPRSMYNTKICTALNMVFFSFMSLISCHKGLFNVLHWS